MKKTLLLFSLLLLLLPQSVHADTIKGTVPESSLSISAINSNSESIFMLNSKPGANLTFTVNVKNVSKSPVEFNLYPADVYPSVGGGWSYLSSTETTKLVGSWFEEKVQKIKLDAGKDKNYSFKMNVPKDIKDGQYIGAILTEEFIPADSKEISDNMGAKSDVYMRLPIQTVININKGNAVRSMKIDNVYHSFGNDGLVTIHIPHINLGTILEKPTGTLVLKNSSNETLIEESYSMDSVYVGTTGLYNMLIQHVILQPDSYILTYNVKYHDKEIKGSYKFKITMEEVITSIKKSDNVGQMKDGGFLEILYKYWIWILAIIILIVSLLFIIILLLIKRRKEKKSDTPTTQKEETHSNGN